MTTTKIEANKRPGNLCRENRAGARQGGMILKTEGNKSFPALLTGAEHAEIEGSEEANVFCSTTQGGHAYGWVGYKICSGEVVGNTTGSKAMAAGQRTPYVSHPLDRTGADTKRSRTLVGCWRRPDAALQLNIVFRVGNARSLPWSWPRRTQIDAGRGGDHHEIPGGLEWINVWTKIVPRHLSLRSGLDWDHFFRGDSPLVIQPLPDHRLRYADAIRKLFLRNAFFFQVFGELHGFEY